MVPQPATFFADLGELVDVANSGGGLPAVHRMVELAASTLGAAGSSFAEYGGSGGRIIAAFGRSEWAVGRPVDLGNTALAEVMARGEVVEATADEMSTELAGYLHGNRLSRMLAARTELNGRLVGSLHAFFEDPGPAGTFERAAIAFFAKAVGHLYADGRGLPVYAESSGAPSVADAVAVVGADGRVRSWNAAAEVVTGFPAAAVVGREPPVRIPSSGRMLEHRLDGRWVQLATMELPGGDRLVTMRDVTEAHRREQARDLFVAVASHELRTPVTVIKGYADTLVDHWGELDEGGRRDAAVRIGQRAGELARLVDRLLSGMGEVSVLTGPPVLDPFDLGHALRSAVRDLPGELRLSARLEVPAALPAALGERLTIRTVLTELVTNAVKYSNPGTPVEITGIADARTTGFRVADRGIGLRPEHVERAFERFWQAESGNQRRNGGVGLGLYLVRSIIERQNGWVSLRPRERGGTVAEVRLPRADQGLGEA